MIDIGGEDPGWFPVGLEPTSGLLIPDSLGLVSKPSFFFFPAKADMGLPLPMPKLPRAPRLSSSSKLLSWSDVAQAALDSGVIASSLWSLGLVMLGVSEPEVFPEVIVAARWAWPLQTLQVYM